MTFIFPVKAHFHHTPFVFVYVCAAMLRCMISRPDFVMHDKSRSVNTAITETCMILEVRTTNHGE